MAETPKPTPTTDVVSRPIPEAKPPQGKRKRKKYRSRGFRITVTLLRLIVLGYVSILVALALMETRLVYPGAYRVSDSGPSANALVQTVEYPTTDGLKLPGRLFENSQAKNVVLFFHGNGVKAAWMDDWCLQLAQAFEATVMIAEYRGYEDDATPTEKDVLSDCFAARDFLCERYSLTPKDIVLYGRSLGGGCAVAVASQGGAKAMVLERTFDRMVNVAADRFSFVPVRLLMKNRYDSVAKLTVYKDPLVVLHGTNDRVIPFPHGEALYQAAVTPQKHWIAVEGLGHNDALPANCMQEIVVKVNEFCAD